MTDYTVNTRNRFALGIEDDDDVDLYELLEKQQEEKGRKAKEAEEAAKDKLTKGKKDKRNTAKSNTKKVSIKSLDKPASAQPQQSTQDNTNSRKSSSYSRNDENRPPRLRNANQNRGPTSTDNFENPPRDLDNGEKRFTGNFRGRGGMRGGFGNNSSRPRREYERHSGSDKTGVKAVEKRDGFGPHNWGDEIQSQLEQPADQQSELNTSESKAKEPVTEGETAEGEAAVDDPNVKVGEDGEVIKEEKTYTEYLAEKKPQAKVVFANTRKANEGTDMKQWKKAVPLERKKKGDLSEEEFEEESEDENEVEETKATLEKLNIQITFGDSSRRGRGGGRGRGFGGSRGGRGGMDRSSDGNGYRGGRAKHHVPQVDNEKEFPTLGGR